MSTSCQIQYSTIRFGSKKNKCHLSLLLHPVTSFSGGKCHNANLTEEGYRSVDIGTA